MLNGQEQPKAVSMPISHSCTISIMNHSANLINLCEFKGLYLRVCLGVFPNDRTIAKGVQRGKAPLLSRSASARKNFNWSKVTTCASLLTPCAERSAWAQPMRAAYPCPLSRSAEIEILRALRSAKGERISIKAVQLFFGKTPVQLTGAGNRKRGACKWGRYSLPAVPLHRRYSRRWCRSSPFSPSPARPPALA